MNPPPACLSATVTCVNVPGTSSRRHESMHRYPDRHVCNISFGVRNNCPPRLHTSHPARVMDLQNRMIWHPETNKTVVAKSCLMEPRGRHDGNSPYENARSFAHSGFLRKAFATWRFCHSRSTPLPAWVKNPHFWTVINFPRQGAVQCRDGALTGCSLRPRPNPMVSDGVFSRELIPRVLFFERGRKCFVRNTCGLETGVVKAGIASGVSYETPETGIQR